MGTNKLLRVVPRLVKKPRSLFGKFDLAIYAAMAFPFVFRILPGFDTQPTFALFFVASLALFSAQRRAFLSEWARKPLQLYAIGMMVFGVLISIVINEEFFSSIQRTASFLLFLVSLLFGLGAKSFINEKRLRSTLYIYAFFTVIYFLSQGFVEALLITSRNSAFGWYLDSGRGASTLSPEPSFFAIQLGSLILLYFLSRRDLIVPLSNELRRSERRLVFLSIVMLMATLSGYGAVYLSILVLILGLRWSIFIVVTGAAAVAFLSEFLSFRIFTLINLAIKEGLVGILLDVSVGERLRSFADQLGIFANTVIGNAFQNLDGGGLISVLAGVGIFSIPFFGLLFLGLIRLRQPLGIKMLAAVWLLLTSISGPIGVPLVGILAGQLMRHATWRQAPVSAA